MARNAANPHPSSRINALTGVRFFAAVGVVCHHFGWQAISPTRAGISGIGVVLVGAMKTGYVGVSFFFVLSGFILAYVYLAPDGSLRGSPDSFWLARFARVYPSYVFAMSLPILPVLLAHAYHAHFLLHLAAVAVLAQSWFPSLAMIWNPPAWSLSAEAFFYAIFPVAAVLIARLNRRRLQFAFVGCWLASLVPPAAYMIWNPDGLPSSWLLHGVDWAFNHDWTSLDAVRFEPIFQAPQFLLGVCTARLLAVCGPDNRAPRPWGAISWAVAAAIAVALCLGTKLPYVLMFNGLLAPLFALLVYALAWEQGKLAAILSRTAIVRLGEASYALYLLHWPIWLVMARLRLASEDPLHFLLYFAVCIVAALATFRYVEAPARAAIRLTAVAISRRVALASN